MSTLLKGIVYAQAILMLFAAITLFTIDVSAQRSGRKIAGAASSAKQVTKKANSRKRAPDGDEIKGVQLESPMGIQRVNAEIQQNMLSAVPIKRPMKPERETRGKDDPKSKNPLALAVPQWPVATTKSTRLPSGSTAAPAPGIHTLGLSFDAGTLSDTGFFPPDSMGAVGPTQYVAFENGRIRTFTKAGVADSVLNANPDVFFSSVITPVGGAVTASFTSDPNVRYDRFTGRWYMSIIDVPCTNASCSTTAANRWLLAVSDAASNGTITGSTVWTFFQVQTDAANFCDYPSLGVDVNALYFGCNMFTGAGGFAGTNGYVVRKSTVLGAGPMTVTSFPNLVTGAAGAGPFAPRGVDNYDPTATEGYFVGTDNATFSTIMFRRVSNPASAAPSISANISVTVPTTTLSGTSSVLNVEHAGNTGGTNGFLDHLDDRLFSAMIRNGRLWTAHSFTVGTTGVASTAAASRNAVRWYEFQSLTTTPALVQSGTVFDNAATRAAARQYWIPSVTVTGQGHAVMGMTMAGTPVGATPVFVGRLSGDTLGTMTGPPTTTAVSTGTTTANYNPPSDAGGTGGRRWGDYSYTMVDPIDDMTVWSIAEYNQASNSYAVRVSKAIAPPPATPSSSNFPTVPAGVASYNLIITGVSSGGSGFYDPGANLAAPARPFTHISASVTGGVVVNSATYIDPTHVGLNLKTTGASQGSQNVTITNPDGQTATGVGLITINGTTAAPADVSGRVTNASGAGLRGVTLSITDGNGFARLVTTNSFGYFVFASVPTGASYVLTPSMKGYSFSPANAVFTHTDTLSGLEFAASPQQRSPLKVK